MCFFKHACGYTIGCINKTGNGENFNDESDDYVSGCKLSWSLWQGVSWVLEKAEDK
jgi:hypothetical protein